MAKDRRDSGRQQGKRENKGERGLFAWLREHQNVGLEDRLLRLLIAEVLGLLAYFWLGGWLACLAWAAAAVMLVTAATGHCGLYTPFKASTVHKDRRTPWPRLVPMLLLIALLPYFGGSYSAQATSQRFMDDFSALDMQTIKAINSLSLNNRQLALQAVRQWQGSFQEFVERYDDYRPYPVKGDGLLDQDFDASRQAAAAIVDLAKDGNLSAAYGKLVAVRNRWIQALNRNGIGTAEIAATSLGETVDLLVQATADRNAPTVLIFYPLTSQLILDLKPDYTSDSVQDVQQALDDLMEAARRGQAEQLAPLAQSLQQKYRSLEPVSQ